MPMRTRAVASLLAIFCFTSQLASADETVRRAYAIRPQPVSAALKQFAAQSHMQLIFSESDVERAQSAGVKGTVSPREALAAILRGTGLEFELTPNHVIVVRKADVIHAGPGAAQPPGATVSPSGKPGAKEGKRSSSSAFRLAQEASRASVSNGRTARYTLDSRKTERSDQEQPQILQEVVVTGLSSGALAWQKAGFAISRLNDQQIEEYAPKTTADLFNAMPGVWAEASGGETGANVFVRGFAQSSGAQFVTVELNGMPIFPPSSVGFIENSALFRLDDSIDHVEALRGGPSPILGLGQPGATFNFIEKKGGPTAQGLAKVTFTDFGTERVDGLYSGPLSSGWYYSFGGFYRTSPGERNAQYQGDRGGQAEFQLTRRMSDGELNIFGRHTADNNTWYVDIPLREGPGGQPEAFPGFSPYYGTYEGNATRLATLEIGPGSPPQTMNVNSADGRGVDLTLLGATLDKKLGSGWALSLKTMYTDGTAHTKGLVGNTPIESLGDFLAQTVASANSDPTVVAAAGAPATGVLPGSLRYAGSGAPITDLSIPVLTVGWWSVDEAFSSFSMDARLTKLFRGNDFTAGVFFDTVRFADLWYLGSNMLMTAQQNGLPIDFALNNGVQATRDGFVGAPFFDRNLSADSRQTALFMSDEWGLSRSLRADLGARVDRYTQNGTQEGLSTGNLDGNPLTLYDNGAVYLNGSYQSLAYQKTHASWTGGVTWTPVDRLTFFGRLNSGLRFPSFDDLANGQVLTETIREYELGAKMAPPHTEISVTAFRALMSNIPFFQVVGDSTILYGENSESNGVEVDADAYLPAGFAINFEGTYQNGHFTNGPYSGNKIFHQPDLEARVGPSYAHDLTEQLRARVFASAWYVGHRFSDVQNLQPLQSFTQVNAGVTLDYGDRWEVQLSGDNLTDVIGLTERDPRIIGTGIANGAFLGRPIFGRSFKLSLRYGF